MEFKYDTLFPKAVPVEIAGKRYTLREASLAAGAAYRDALMACRLDEKGEVRESYRAGFKGFNATKAVLVAGCLFGEDDNKPVSLEFVLALPSRIVFDLFAWCEEASGLGYTEDTLKNGQSGTPTTSSSPSVPERPSPS